jgi:hypothetical protein
LLQGTLGGFHAKYAVRLTLQMRLANRPFIETS